MRVNADAARATAAARSAGRASFEAALARARRAGESDARIASRAPAVPDPARRDAPHAARREAQRERHGDEGGAAGALAPPPDLGRRTATPEPSVAALRAAMRTLPVAIEAARVRDGGPLELALGQALAVELRPARTGIEIVLRPTPALARETAAELPGLVRALRARGIAIARAEVRPRGAPRGGGTTGARVDAAQGLR